MRGVRIAALCLAIATGQAQNPDAILSALRSKQYARALETADRELQAAPQNPQILTLRGIALRGMGRDRDALDSFEKALRANPEYIAALEGAAQIEYAAGRVEVVPLLERLLKLRPDDPTAHAMRGVMAWRQHDCATAVGHFDRAREAVAAQPEALREYGVCLARLKRLAPAEDVFHRLVSADPTNSPARRSLAAVQLTSEKPRAALDTLKPLLGGGSADAESLALASAALEASGDTPGAVAALRQAIVLAPRNATYYLDFANLSFAHQSFSAGIQMLTAGLQVLPESSEMHLARGILYVQTGRTDEADRDFALSERLNPRQPGTVDARVLERLQRNDLDGAAALVRNQIKLLPGDAFLHYLLAEVLNWQGPPADSPLFRDALNSAERAVTLQPDLILARNLLSRLYLDDGKVQAAIDQCREVLRADPHDPIALYRLMRALKMSDDPQARKEVPDVLRRFNEARELSARKEAQENRYRLVEDSSAAGKQ